MLLPFIDQAALYNSANFNHGYNENSGNAPNNRTVTRTFLPAFACPSDPAAIQYKADAAPTSYAFCAGPAASWSMGRRNNPGCFTKDVTVKFRDITDGTTNTIIMGEVKVGVNDGIRTRPSVVNRAGGDANTATGTSNGRRYSATQANIDAIKTYHAACAAAITTTTDFLDDTNRYWSAGNTSYGPWFNTLMPPNTPVHCDDNTSTTELRLKSAQSEHEGGVQVLLGDASARFVSENIDHGVWISVGTKGDGETIGEW